MGVDDSELLTVRMYSTSCGVQSSTDQNTVTSYINSLVMLTLEVFESVGVLRSAINPTLIVITDSQTLKRC